MKRKRHTNHSAAVLAKQKNAELIASDPEFKAVASEIKIAWLSSRSATLVRGLPPWSDYG